MLSGAAVAHNRSALGQIAPDAAPAQPGSQVQSLPRGIPTKRLSVFSVGFCLFHFVARRRLIGMQVRSERNQHPGTASGAPVRDHRWPTLIKPSSPGPNSQGVRDREGRCAVIVPLWEWAVMRDERSSPVGVCMTQHGAMEALSKALVAAGHPSKGRVAQVKLSRPAHTEPTYLRGFPERKAVYDGAVIQWS